MCIVNLSIDFADPLIAIATQTPPLISILWANLKHRLTGVKRQCRVPSRHFLPPISTRTRVLQGFHPSRGFLVAAALITSREGKPEQRKRKVGRVVWAFRASMSLRRSARIL